MYDIDDKASAIKNVQKFLYTISKVNPLIPPVIPDGIYGDETIRAVIAFQKYKGIEESGKVDYETFTLLVEDYRDAQRELEPPRRIRVFPARLAGGAVNPGDESHLVSALQGILLGMGAAYPEFADVKVTGKHDEATVRAVNTIKKAAGLPEDGRIDKKTFGVLADLYERYINEDQ